jgi:hypothetical protein
VAFPPPRRSPLTAEQGKKYFLWFFAALLTVGLAYTLYQALCALFHWEVRADVVNMFAIAVDVTFPLGFLAFGVLVWRSRRKILICLNRDGLTVSRRPGDLFSFTDAKLGPWGPGTALHLLCDTHSFVLGGRDHRPASGIRLDAPPTDSIDAWMSASDFDELLTMVGRRSGLDGGRPAPGEPTRCLLYANSDVLQNSGPWTFGDETHLHYQPRKPSLAFDVGDDAIRVIDPNTNALKASAGVAQVTAIPQTYECRVDMVRYTTSWESPVVVVGVPGMQPVTVGCQEGKGAFGFHARFSWRGNVRRANERAAYIVTGRDWVALAEKCGLASDLEEHW